MSRLERGRSFRRGRADSNLPGDTAPQQREDRRLFRLQTRKGITQLTLGFET